VQICGPERLGFFQSISGIETAKACEGWRAEEPEISSLPVTAFVAPSPRHPASAVPTNRIIVGSGVDAAAFMKSKPAAEIPDTGVAPAGSACGSKKRRRRVACKRPDLRALRA
jgi:hypothetical protein